MLITRFTLVLRPDTEDPDEAIQDALDFIASSKEGWYSSVRLDSEIEVAEYPNNDEEWGEDNATQRLERG
jgi:hypothetical protein